MRSTSPLAATALAEINKLVNAIAAKGYAAVVRDDLDPGIRKCADWCPIARSIPYGSGGVEVCPAETGGIVRFRERWLAELAVDAWGGLIREIDDDVSCFEVLLPAALNEFALEFDAGNLPEYEEPDV